MKLLPLGLAPILFGLGYFLGERNDVRDIRNLAIGSMLAVVFGSASSAYAFTPYACSDLQFNDFCGFGYTLLGYGLSRIGLLTGLMACGVALRIALRQRNWRRVAFLLIGGLIPLCLPFVAFEVRGVLFISGLYDAENALAIFAAGITPYILSAIAPLPLLVYALYLMRHAPPAPADAAGGLA